MSENQPSLSALLRDYVTHRQADLRVCLPGIVESYDAAKQTVDVQPTLHEPKRDRDGTKTGTRLPVIHNVPVVFSRTQEWFVSLPIKAGDRVMLVFSDFSLDSWKTDGREGRPNSDKAHDINDAVAFVGGYDQSHAIADINANDLIVGKAGGTTIRIKGASGEIHLGQDNPTSFVALADKVATELQKIQTTLSTGANGGGAVVFATPYVAGSVAATKVKAV